MSRFHFTLRPLLKARRHVEQARQRAVAQIEHERQELEENLRRQQGAIAEGRRSLRSGLVGSVDSAGLRLHAAASIQLMRRAQHTLLELAGVHKRLDAARVELVEAARHRRVVELLRDQRYAQWIGAQAKAEMALIDELAVSAAARAGAPFAECIP